MQLSVQFWSCFFVLPSVQAETAAQRGYRLLTTKAYLPADFDQKVFDEVWRQWPEPLRSRAGVWVLQQGSVLDAKPN